MGFGVWGLGLSWVWFRAGLGCRRSGVLVIGLENWGLAWVRPTWPDRLASTLSAPDSFFKTLFRVWGRVGVKVCWIRSA